MRWCVLGAGGQLGFVATQLISDSAAKSGDEVVALTRSQVDITDVAAVARLIEDLAPDVVLNAAAYTDVDASESNRDLATLINEKAPALVAKICRDRDVRFVQVSTDYVFDGSSVRPYTEIDQTDPINFYGKSKLRGEQAVLTMHPDAWVVRTSWLYAPGFRNFPFAILNRLKLGESFGVVNDQIGTPTAARDFALGLLDLVNLDAPGGVYHLVSQGQASWFEFAREIAISCGFDPDLIQASASADSPRPAQRPRYSVLSTQKWLATGLKPLPGWQQGWQAQAGEFLEAKTS